MNTVCLDRALPVDTTIPDPSLVCLIGPAGSGKSTWASTWPDTQVLELDRFRALVSDDAGCQEATGDAAAALQAVLKARLARRKMTIVDATNTEKAVRADLLQAARDHGVPAVAFLVCAPVDVCIARQAGRSPARAVPEDVVRRQHADTIAAFPHLRDEGFAHVVFADTIHRLEPLLRRASATRRAELGWNGGGGLPGLRRAGCLLGLLTVRRVFGSEVLPLWRWRADSQLAGGDRVGEIRLGPDRMVLALRTSSEDVGAFGFDLLVGCPVDDGCVAPAWAPVFSVCDLLAAHTTAIVHPDTVCTVHGGPDRTGCDQGGDHTDGDETHAPRPRL
ncbi:ATP-binding protein [Streptomyces monomycini]|uniref:ATP-binding protein n=1 Tax=Streptomyces monomycini TaxID=371720 RepID=UPI0004AB2F26|nr:ATP-binding protein [Streptomyces monomycini]